MDRHDRENLLNGPGVRQGLKDAEIAMVDIGQHPVKVSELRARIFQVFGQAVHLGDGCPEELLSQRTLAQGDFAIVEESPCFIAVEDDIVEHFLNVADI